MAIVDPARLRAEAMNDVQADRLSDAMQKFGLLLSINPDDADAMHWQAVIQLRRGNADEARRWMGLALKAAPHDPRLHCNNAEILRVGGDLAGAESSARRALELRPDYPEAWLNLAAALAGSGRDEDALDAANQALSRRPGWPAAQLLRADALRALGHVDAAEGAYRAVMDALPDNGAALSNLARMLIENGRLDEGISLYRRATQAPGASSETFADLAQILLECDRVHEALAVLEPAIEQDPNSAVLSLIIGRAWAESGDVSDARDWLDRALHLDPGLVEAEIRLAHLACDVDDPSVAVARMDRLLAASPDRIDALVARSRARTLCGDVASAITDLKAAIDLHPRSASLAARLGNLLASGGAIDAAVQAYERALEIDPGCIAALSGLLTTRKARTTTAVRDQAEALLTVPLQTERRRAALHFGLAAWHDGAENWDEAGRHLEQGNALRKAAEQTRGRGYDPDVFEAFVDAQIAAFTPEVFTRLTEAGHTEDRPVFIVGMPRSGTTLTEQILASHSRCFGAGERPFASRSMALLPHMLGRPDRPAAELLTEADPAMVRRCADWHLSELDGLDGGKAARIVDKMPDNANLLGWLALTFPKARFIYCRRDLRDVALSCWMTNFTEIRWSNDLDHLAHRIRQHRRLMDHWRTVLPVDVLTLDYEALVADQEGESRRLIDWLGLDWEDRCLEFFRTERLVKTASVSQVRKPIYTRSIGRWRRYEGFLGPVLDGLASG